MWQEEESDDTTVAPGERSARQRGVAAGVERNSTSTVGRVPDEAQ